MSEEYRTIERYPEYEISKSGNVRRKKTRNILASTTVHGHPKIILKGKTEYISRLVAETYIPNPLNNPVVRHLDGNKMNTHSSNIEWATRSVTQRDSYFYGIDAPCGNGKPKPIRIVETGQEFPSINACAKAINGSSSGIRQCLSGRSKTYKHYHYEFVY